MLMRRVCRARAAVCVSKEDLHCETMFRLLDLVLCGEAKSARQLLAGQKDPVCSARESPPALLAWTHPAGTASARATAGKHVPLPARAFERSRI